MSRHFQHKTPITENLVEISRDYPIVEWGVLFSKSNQGRARYPSQHWLKTFGGVMNSHPGIRLCAHLCGGYVRDFVLGGQYTWATEHHQTRLNFQRVQINFHGQFHRMTPAFPEMLRQMPSTQFILQCDGVNDDAVLKLASEQLCVPLFDTSGGAGVLPEEWPIHWPHVYCGYAGGLGPLNIVGQVLKIQDKSPGSPYWIDMERRVRSEDDELFDLSKVCDVLEQVAGMNVWA